MGQICKFLDQDWLSLRGWQETKFINSMYIWIFIVPVFANVLHKINKTLTFQIFGQPVELMFSLPFSWKVFFFCALCFGIANIIVIIFCPKIIKHHLSYAGFRGDGKGLSHLQEYGHEIGLRIIEDVLENKTIGEQEIYIKECFWSIYNQANLYRKFWRRLCVIFYVLGFILFLDVFIRNIVWVVSFVFNP